LALDVTHFPDLAGCNPLHHLDIGRRVTAIEADVQRDACRFTCRGRTLGIGTRQRERLLGEHMLARAGRCFDLVRMPGMRRR